MTRMNRKLEYALMVLRFMSQNEAIRVSAKEVSNHLQTSYDVTARVMQTLSSGGLLQSEYGSSGGYMLTKDLSKVSMLTLIEIIEGPTEITRCLSKDEKCELKGSCNIMSPIEKLSAKLNHFYLNISLQDLFTESATKKQKQSRNHEVLNV
jgi:Rrf2 family protein